MIKKILFIIILFIPTTAQADWIMLNNGDRVSGTITSDNSSKVSIQSDLMGTLSIPRSKIASVHKGPSPRVLARELRTGKSIGTAALEKSIKTNSTKTLSATNEKAEVKEQVRKDGVYKWTGRLGAGGNIEDGNTSSKSITADADIKARDKKNRFSFGGESNWAEDLQIKAGPEYIYEKFENDDTESDIALGWALDYDQKLYDKSIQIFHKHDMSTPFADTSAFLFESETGARIPIGERLDASMQVDPLTP